MTILIDCCSAPRFRIIQRHATFVPLLRVYKALEVPALLQARHRVALLEAIVVLLLVKVPAAIVPVVVVIAAILFAQLFEAELSGTEQFYIGADAFVAGAAIGVNVSGRAVKLFTRPGTDAMSCLVIIVEVAVIGVGVAPPTALR